MRNLLSLLLILSLQSGFGQLTDHLETIRNQGEVPLSFVRNKLTTYDLILFDDGLHSAFEPFQFYNELIQKSSELDFIFVEVFAINVQPLIDAYLNGDEKDETLLYKVFQNDFSGFGWRYQTYLDLLETVWEYNHRGDALHQIEVIGVDQPIYWEALHNREDYDLYLQSHIGRDYFMYRTISRKMDDFRSGKKGIFLSNTRHVYKHIKKKNGTLFWNAGTFFTQWHPDMTYSIRFHNASLFIESENNEPGKGSSQGLEKINFRWDRVGDGLWDKAFNDHGNQPVAVPLKDNVFGETSYVGNHMHKAMPGQTMNDAYDAIIFLAPLDELHQSASANFFYTESFQGEIKRRLSILHEDRLAEFLKRNNCKTPEEFISQLTLKQPIKKNGLIYDFE